MVGIRELPIVETTARTCYDCQNRSGCYCMITGYSCARARQYPEEPCNKNWSGWTPRRQRKSLLVRLVRIAWRIVRVRWI